MKTIDKLRQDLKAKGWNSRRISVKSGPSMYDTRIDVTVKDITTPIREVENVTKKYEEIDRCQASGEILAGGNTYAFVSYDYDTQQAAIKERMPQAEEALKSIKDLAEGESKRILEKDGMNLWYMRGRDGDKDRVALFDPAGNSMGGITIHNSSYIAIAIMKTELY